jgi:hypothetical protein
MPQNMGAKNSRTATPDITVKTTTAATNTQIPLQGVGANSPHIGKVIPMGTFINFGGVGKVYMLTQSITLNVETMTAYIYPALRTQAAQGAIMYYKDDVKMNVKYDTDVVRGMVYEDGILMDNGVIKLIEAL